MKLSSKIKEEKKKRRKEEKNGEIRIAHVLTKISQIPIKREMCCKEHSRIRLATLYIHLMFQTHAHLSLIV